MSLTMNQYQDKALVTAKGRAVDTEMGLVYTVLGLNGEAGEVAEKLKKHIRDDQPLGDETAQELGDVLWYLAVSCYNLGYTLDEVAQMNIDKLASRKERSAISGSGDDR